MTQKLALDCMVDSQPLDSTPASKGAWQARPARKEESLTRPALDWTPASRGASLERPWVAESARAWQQGSLAALGC